MSKQPSLRARASPAAVLVKREHAELAEFVRRVGAVAYGTEWPFASTASLPSSLSENRTVGSNEELVWFVRDQILLALQAGVITAAIPLTVSEKRDYDDDEEDDKPPKLKIFKVNSAFWATPFEHKKLDWNASKVVSIETQHLSETITIAQPGMSNRRSSFQRLKARATKSKDIPLAEKYDALPSFSGVSIRILRPESALRSMFNYEELPDEAWLSRYKIYRDNIKYELIAAAWRYINIAKLEKKHGIKTKLVRAMQDYMRSQGIDVDAGQGPSQAVLMEMAARIVAQWEQENLSVSVLVSTNPRKPKI